MNLAKDAVRTIQAMVDVEGPAWLADQLVGKYRGASVFDALVELATVFQEAAPFPIQTVIYGSHGWNRYCVRSDGSVWFVELQAPSASQVEKARKAGFEIL